MASPFRSAGRSCLLFAAPVAVAVATAATVLTACAAPVAASAAAEGVDTRVLVKRAQPGGDTTAIAAEASRLAGLPVRYAASVNGVWHALVLHCVDAAACDAAMVRMRRSGVYAAVELDGHKSRAAMN
jgi:hypothetical protein